MKTLAERQLGTLIAQLLQEAQHTHGYLSDEEIHKIANTAGVPVRMIQDVVDFFPHYRRIPPPRCRVSVCRDMSCRLRGSVKALEALKELQQQVGADQLEVHDASCLGRCDRAPAMLIESEHAPAKLYVNRTPAEIREIVAQMLNGIAPAPDSDQETAALTLARSEIDCYRQEGSETSIGRPNEIGAPYEAVRRLIASLHPERVIDALKTAGLLGMGGAGAPAYSKWDEARLATGEAKYVVCNADESEPGTFKDRELLLASPHLILEGMIVAGLVIGAKRGYIYVRHEYFEQIDALKYAIREAEKLGACGRDVFQSGREFHLEVFVSPGGYVCGEQTALIEALEGKRSEPRNRPPELQTNGLYDQPTILNNVETFAWVPSILLRTPGDDALQRERQGNPQATAEQPGLWFKHAGSGTARGKRFFSISGDVQRPGAYEVPCGITLGELIDRYAGGLRPGVQLKAVALSGPSGGFLPALLPANSLRSVRKRDRDGNETDEHKYPDLAKDPASILHLPLDIDASRELGFMLGAGIVVYGDDVDMLDQTHGCTLFYQRESCGKCVPCRIGSRKMADLTTLLVQQESPVDAASLENALSLSRVMKTTSICGLGQVASEPLRTYVRYFHSNKG